MVGDMLRTLPADRFPSLAAGADVFAAVSWDDQFMFGLERRLDGIAVDLAAVEAARGSVGS